MAIFVKDPGATIDYAIDWSAGYLAGQQIIDSVWSVAPSAPAGIAVEIGRIEPGKTIVTLSGGQIGRIYRIANRVRLSDGRTDERTLVVRVEER